MTRTRPWYRSPSAQALIKIAATKIVPLRVTCLHLPARRARSFGTAANGIQSTIEMPLPDPGTGNVAHLRQPLLHEWPLAQQEVAP